MSVAKKTRAHGHRWLACAPAAFQSMRPAGTCIVGQLLVIVSGTYAIEAARQTYMDSRPVF